MKAPCFIDLFAGIGGFRLALEKQLKLNCVFSSEWDTDAQEVYYQNFKERPWGDITKIDEKAIPAHDILCAGFPCQAFSISGKRQGFEDIRGTLFFDILRIARFHRPRVLLLENVKNFLSHDHGRTFNVVKTSLEDCGYTVFHKVLRSSDFGVPQARERVYIVAIKDWSADFHFPSSDGKLRIVKDILLDLSPREFSKLQIKRDDMNFYRNELEFKDPRSPWQVGKINKGGQGERIYSVYASGITLSAFGGGAAAKTGAYKIGRRVRKLHPLECLKLQGFPKDFILGTSVVKSHQQLGNSVSVPVIAAIARSIKVQVFDGEASSLVA